jgi:hypothetical protein
MGNKMLRLVVYTKKSSQISHSSKFKNLYVRDINPDDRGKQISKMPVLSQPEADSLTAFQGMDN